MLKILAIGNSFSDDSTTYLEKLVRHEGQEIKVVNLFIGACSLETHWDNVLHNNQAYDYRIGGESIGKTVSIHEAIAEEEWDVITLQQYSGHSGIIGTYYPFVNQLYNDIKNQLPETQVMLHQTWAYEMDASHDDFSLYHNNQWEMYHALQFCYKEVAKDLNIPIIPFGEVIQTIRSRKPFQYEEGGYSLCRDGYHMDEVFGRYALALTWYGYVLKGDVMACTFYPDVMTQNHWDEEAIRSIKQSVQSVLHG